MHRLLISSFVALFATHSVLFGYIVTGQKLTLKNGVELVVLGDAYYHLDHATNALNGLNLWGAVENIARAHPSKMVIFSYEESAVYDPGFALVDLLKHHEQHYRSLCATTNYLGFVEPCRGYRIFQLANFIKFPNVTTFLCGQLTQIIALTDRKAIPGNLKVKSNDPRRFQYLPMKQWVKAHQEFLLMSDLFAIPFQFRQNQYYRTSNHELSKAIVTVLTELETQLQSMVELQQELLKLHLENEFGYQLPQGFAYMNLTMALKDRIEEKIDSMLDLIAENRIKGELYNNAPLLEVLYPVFEKNPAPIQIALLGHKLANRLIEVLYRMDIVKHYTAYENPSKELESLFWMSI